MIRHDKWMTNSPRPASPLRRRSLLGLVAWIALLVAVSASGPLLARGSLSPPSLSRPGSWAEWASGRTPLEAVFAVLGLLVVVLAWYLLAATVLVAAARRRGAGRLVSVAELLALPVVRRTVHAALGVGLVGASVAGTASQAGEPASRQARPAPALELVVATTPATESAVDLGPDGCDDASADDAPADDASVDGASADDAPVMRLVPAERPTQPAPVAEPSPPSPPSTELGAGVVEREVLPGDHLWSMAAAILSESGEQATDVEVSSYWRLLVEANLDRLADPANPDLLFPGQLVAVPTPPTPTPVR